MTGPTDVLSAGDERLPRRLTRRQVCAAMVALLLVAGAARAVGWSRHQSQERRLDQTAVAALSLIVLDNPFAFIDGGTDVAIQLRNDGPQRVRVHSARVDLPGYRQLALHADLAPDAATPLRIASTPTCGTAVATMGQVVLLVEVVTARGTQRQLRLPLLAGSTGLLVRSRAQQVCGMMPTAQSVNLLAAIGPRSSPREAVLDLTLENVSVLPLQLRAIDAGAGLRVTVQRRLPLALPARAAPQAGSPLVGVLVRVAPTNCAVVVGRTRLTDAPLGDLSLELARGAQRSSSSVSLDPPVAAAIKALATGCARSPRAGSGGFG